MKKIREKSIVLTQKDVWLIRDLLSGNDNELADDFEDLRWELKDQSKRAKIIIVNK